MIIEYICLTHYGNDIIEMTYSMRGAKFLSLTEILQHRREEMSRETVLNKVDKREGVDVKRQTRTLCT